MMPTFGNSQPPGRCLPGRAHSPSVHGPSYATPAPIHAPGSRLTHCVCVSQPAFTYRHARQPQVKNPHPTVPSNPTPSPAAKQNPLKTDPHATVSFTARVHHFRGDQDSSVLRVRSAAKLM